MACVVSLKFRGLDRGIIDQNENRQGVCFVLRTAALNTKASIEEIKALQLRRVKAERKRCCSNIYI